MISEPFEPSPYIPSISKGFENDFNLTAGWQQKEQTDADASAPVPTNEKESNARENNVAKIRVVVRGSGGSMHMLIHVYIHMLYAHSFMS